jgi:hypothetical protein
VKRGATFRGSGIGISLGALKKHLYHFGRSESRCQMQSHAATIRSRMDIGSSVKQKNRHR